MANTNLLMPAQRLFSPGPVQLQYKTDLVFSHRSNEFKQLYGEVSARLSVLSGYKNVVMTQGSATSAVETVLSSVLKSDSRILMLVNGEFGRRAAQMANFYTDSVIQAPNLDSFVSLLDSEDFDFCFMVLFETSLSIYNNSCLVEEFCNKKGIPLIVDAVSAFPYYELPSAKFIITTSSKQLRGLPAMGLVFFDCIEDIDLIERSDYLNLKRCVEYAKLHQTPHTSLIPQLDSLNQALKDLDISQLRLNIARNAMRLILGLESRVINESICPVITLCVDNPEKIVTALHDDGISVYQNSFYTKNYIQIGCFNYDDEKNYVFLNELLHKELLQKNCAT